MAEAAYRYLSLGEIKTGVFSTAERISADDHVTHDVLLAIFYRF